MDWLFWLKLYALVGLVWGGVSVYMAYKHGWVSTPWGVWALITFLLNMLTWPLSMPVGVHRIIIGNHSRTLHSFPERDTKRDP